MSYVIRRKRDFDLAVNATRSNKRRVKTVDAVSSHDHSHVFSVVEAIQLVEQFQHGSLHFFLAVRTRDSFTELMQLVNCCVM